jgi:hypothetical protein
MGSRTPPKLSRDVRAPLAGTSDRFPGMVLVGLAASTIRRWRRKVIRTIMVYSLPMVLFRLTRNRGLIAVNMFDFIVIFLLSKHRAEHL